MRIYYYLVLSEIARISFVIIIKIVESEMLKTESCSGIWRYVQGYMDKWAKLCSQFHHPKSSETPVIFNELFHILTSKICSIWLLV